jgi:transcriptional regulator with XRE-family HTH domain
MTEAFITPKVLRWARKRKHLSLAQAAQKAGVSVKAFTDWEHGTSRPEFSQARELARMLDIPFGYLWMSTAPNFWQRFRWWR